MKPLTLFLLALLLILPPVTTTAQRRRPGTRPTTAAPPAQPAPTPAPPVAASRPQAPVPVAIVNGQTLTTADLDPRVRQEVEGLEQKIAETRREILDVQINTILLELEARKRRLTTPQLYTVEVSKRIPEPSAADVTRFIEQNRDEIGAGDEATIRKQVSELMRSSYGARLQEEFVRRLRKIIPVTMGVDINTPNLTPSAVIATIAGQPLPAGPLLERLKPTIYKLRLDTYELERASVEGLINDMLVVAEANRRNIGPEVLVRTEVSEKAHRPDDAEVAKFYAENRKDIRGELNVVQT